MNAAVLATTAGRQQALAARVRDVSAVTLGLLNGLSAEDCMLQSMPEASPIKWHVGHVTWFFETFLLEQTDGFQPFDPAFRELFNSYYVGVGERHPRAERGLLSRPPLDQVLAYHRRVHHALADWLESAPLPDPVLDLVELGIHHQQQHQELMVTDLKHHFWRNPLLPAWMATSTAANTAAELPPMRFVAFAEGKADLGTSSDEFAFDNERPAHTAWVMPFELATRPVCNGDYVRFVEDGGYTRPELWLSDGWDQCRRDGWQAPLYWVRQDAGWSSFTVRGLQPLVDAEPVCHLSYYEADAYARWADARLPTEQEWEHAARRYADAAIGNFADSGDYHPRAVEAQDADFVGLLGGVWEWTQSAYLAYPGFRTAEGAVGEYNGKFMINQMVLRGGSCATPASHIRSTYRNFFAPASRWQFSGLRLARS